MQENNFIRKTKLVTQLSPGYDDYLATPERTLVPVTNHTDTRGWRLNPGWGRLVLALFGCVTAIKYEDTRKRWILFLATIGLTAFFLSFGTRLHIGTWHPWEFLRETIPGVAQIRSVFRFSWLVQLAVLLLSVEGVARLQQTFRRLNSERPVTKVISFVTLCLVPATICAMECLPDRTTRGGVVDTAKQPEWIQFLKNQEETEPKIACFPFATGSSASDYDVTTRWMIHGLNHRAKMVNGYSGFFPVDYISLRNLLNREFPSQQSIDKLREFDVRYLVVSRRFQTAGKIEAATAQTLKHVCADPTGIDIYQISSAEK